MNGWAYALLGDLFKSFNHCELDVVLMRSNDWLNDLPVGDIDLLVLPDQLKRIMLCIDRFTKEENWQKIFVDTDSNHTHLVYVKLHQGEFRSVHIDLQTSLGRKGFLYCSSSEVMSTPVLIDGIYVQNEANAVYSLMLHVLLDKGKIKDEYRQLILNVDPNTLEELLVERLDGHMAVLIMNWVSNGLSDENMSEVCSATRKFLVLRYPMNRVFPLVHKVCRVSRYFARRRGVLIAALGPDGAGKSTVVEKVDKMLAFGAFPVATVYMGKRETLLPTSKLIRLYYDYKEKKTKGKNGEPVSSAVIQELTEDKPRSAKKNWIACVKEALGLSNWFLEQWARYLIDIRPVMQQGGVVLCDRYIYDLADRSRRSIVYSKSFAWFLKVFFPTPDITYFYWEEPEVLYERKMENTVERSAFLIANYRAILSNIPNVIEVRTNIDADEICIDVTDRIVTTMEI
ncbi:MAG: hypothetical protein L3J89_12000 [Gammaproteobacteria bacterium]|nr:hypothetical protein [Gammaproteobacteria bacterium]